MENLNEKQIKCVRFWLLRILSENLVESNKINKRIGDLSYQAENLSKMLNSKDQLQVISDLNKDMDKFGWTDTKNGFTKELEELS